MTSDPLCVLGNKCLSSSFRGLVNHNNFGGLVLTDSLLERFNAEFSVTLPSQIAVERFDPLAEVVIDFECDHSRNGHGLEGRR